MSRNDNSIEKAKKTKTNINSIRMPLVFLGEKLLGIKPNKRNRDYWKITAGIIFFIGLFFLLSPTMIWQVSWWSWSINSNQFGAIFALLGVITYARVS